MRLLICGSRDWRDAAVIRAKLHELKPDVVIHGDCSLGADALASDLCRELGIRQEKWPALWGIEGRRAGPLRNQRMLDASKPELVLAFHSLKRSPGTDDMLRRAEAAGVPSRIVWEASR